MIGMSKERGPAPGGLDQTKPFIDRFVLASHRRADRQTLSPFYYLILTSFY